ncbi:hypothetical protein PPUJ21368_17170 [Pseudomonas putida]|nr:hypothetical protein PPUJ21368_17170 [Pseudomonas putida]
MSRVTTDQARCQSQADAGCKRAGGYTFLVFEWLPWTAAGCCRKCAVFVKPQLLAAQASTMGGHLQLIIDNAPKQLTLDCPALGQRGAANGMVCS